MEYEIVINNRKLSVTINDDKILVDGEELEGVISQRDDRYLIHEKKRIHESLVLKRGHSEYQILINGKKQEVVVNDHISILLKKLGMTEKLSSKTSNIKAPMPGAILDIMVAEGEEVDAGQALLILEAMKMENLIKAPAEGRIKKINVEKGDNVEKNNTLIEFE